MNIIKPYLPELFLTFSIAVISIFLV